MFENIVYGWKDVTREDVMAAIPNRQIGQIIVLDGNGIVEMGTHGELVARNGILARLYASQAFWLCNQRGKREYEVVV